jgi:hypothetical protein
MTRPDTSEDQERRDALMTGLAESAPDVAETLELFAAGIEAYTAAAVDVWEPPTHVSNTSGSVA